MRHVNVKIVCCCHGDISVVVLLRMDTVANKNEVESNTDQNSAVEVVGV